MLIKSHANLAKNMGIDKELYKDSIEIDASKEQLKQMAQEAMAQGASPARLNGWRWRSTITNATVKDN
jgi:hypothetical protein